MSEVFSLVAKIQAKSGKEAELKAALIDLIDKTRAEEGCVNYDLHLGEDDASMFVFYENWATKTHWEAHNESEHIAAFMAKAEELVDNSELIQLRPYGDIAAVK